MSKKHRFRMRKKWEHNPHCYWCGCETVWNDDTAGYVPPETATIDHIRSRLCNMRAARDDGTWPPGIWVLSCQKCNNERASLETAWFKSLRPDEFYDKGNSRPADPELLKAQSKLSTALLNLIRRGGTVQCDVFGVSDEVLRLANNLQRLYNERNAEKRVSKLSRQ